MTRARDLADFNAAGVLTSTSDLDATNLTSGTIPDGRYGAPTFNGANLTNVHNTPHFRAYRSGNLTNLVSDGWREVICNAEDSDSGNYYNSTTGRFTPQSAGYYQVQFTGSAINFGGQSTAAVQQLMYGIKKNGTGDPVAVNYIDLASSNVQRFTATVSTIVYLNGVTDYVSPYVYVPRIDTSGSLLFDIAGERQYTNFSAFKLTG